MRRYSLLALTLVLVVLSVGDAAAALRFEPVASPGRFPSGDGKDTVLYESAPGARTLLRDGRPVGTFSIPGDCLTGEVSEGGADVVCGSGTIFVRPPSVLWFSDGVIRDVPGGRGGALDFGARWMEIEETQYRPDPGPTPLYRSLVDWRTGRRIDLRSDPFGPRRVIDLDRREPARRLCRPLRRPGNPDAPAETTRYGRMERRGEWVLTRGERLTVQRCGERRPRFSFRSRTPLLLTSTHLATAPGSRRVILRSLRSGRRTVISEPRMTSSYALTRDHLYVGGTDPGGTPTVYRARLPW